MGIVPELQRVLAGIGFKTDINVFLAVFGLLLARMVTVVSFVPFLGGKSLPTQARVGIGVMLAAVAYPSVAVHETIAAPGAVAFLALLAKEVLIGAAIGLVAQFVFLAVQMAGAMIDLQRGMNQFAFFAPQLPGNISILGLFYFQAALVLFVMLDGHLVFIRALHDSFTVVPLLTFPAIGTTPLELTEKIMRLSAGAFVIGFELSAPVLITLFLVDVCFGVIGKVASQVQVHAESQPVKAVVGLAIVFLSAGLLLDRLTYHLTQMLPQVRELFGRVA